MNKNYLREVKVVFGIGIALILFAPYLFTRYSGIVDFSGTGQIGDTIGGLTSPLTSLLGSILVFYALKAQIDANQLIQQQINTQKTDEEIKKNVQYLFDNFKIIREDINDYSVFEHKHTGGGLNERRVQIVTHKGAAAFSYFISQLKELRQDQFEEAFEVVPKLTELKSLLDSISLFLTQVEDSAIPKEDKIYLKNLMAYQVNSKIKSPFKANQKYRAHEVTNRDGVKYIKGIPDHLFEIVENINLKLS